MRISVFGLGYVGCVTAACFAEKNLVTGVDVDKDKIECINRGKAPFYEKTLDALIDKALKQKKLKVTSDYLNAVLQTDISFITVGTPGDKNGNLNMTYVYDVCSQIGEALKTKESFHSVVIRSTVVPGTVKNAEMIIAEKSGKRSGKDFTVALNPEFLREGSAVNDFLNPGIVLAGTDNDEMAESIKGIYSEIVNLDENRFLVTNISIAEIIKAVNNALHALKICFANEVGNICRNLNVDGKALMEIVCADKKLNISDYYLKPGFAYGGSCIPKDLAELSYLAKQSNTKIPLIDSIEISNRQQIQNLTEIIKNSIKENGKIIGFLGLAFKNGTSDLRLSPVIEIIKNLYDEKRIIRTFDEYAEKTSLPDWLQNSFSEDMNTLLESSNVIVIVNSSEKYKNLCNKYPEKHFIDLSGQNTDCCLYNNCEELYN